MCLLREIPRRESRIHPNDICFYIITFLCVRACAHHGTQVEVRVQLQQLVLPSHHVVLGIPLRWSGLVASVYPLMPRAILQRTSSEGWGASMNHDLYCGNLQFEWMEADGQAQRWTWHQMQRASSKTAVPACRC